MPQIIAERPCGLCLLYMTNHQPIHVGVVGCGWIMRSIYTPTLLSMPDLVSVSAVCDRNTRGRPRERRTIPQRGGLQRYPNAILRGTKLDAVLVSENQRKGHYDHGSTETAQGEPARFHALEKPPADQFGGAGGSGCNRGRRVKSFVYAAFNQRAHAALHRARFLPGEDHACFRRAEAPEAGSRDLSPHVDPSHRLRPNILPAVPFQKAGK